MTSPSEREPEHAMHQLNNHLGIVVGMCDLLVLELRESDPKRADLIQVQNAGRAALGVLEDLARGVRELRASLDRRP